MNVILTLLISYLFIPTRVNDFQEKERFDGQLLLTECLEEIPVSYSTKDKEPFMEAVNRLDSVELVLVTTKKRKDPTYEFYYFDKFEAVDGESAYLVSPEEFNNQTTEHSALFLKYKKNEHFFYRADCFRQKLKEYEQLNQILKKE